VWKLTAVRRLVVVVLLAGLWLVAGGTAAPAHAVLRSSDPADGASVARAPRQVTLTFTERPEPRLSTVQVLDADGRPVQAGKAAPVAGQPFQLQVPLGALGEGTYAVAWRTVSRDDGHVSGGSFAFGVGVAAPTGGPQGASVPAATTPAPSPLATAGRWLLYCGLALLVGAAATGLAVYDRRLPPGARPLLWAGASLAVVGLAARVAAEKAAVGASLGDLVASDTGRNLAWLTAGVLASATAAGLLAARIRQPDRPHRATMADNRHARPGDGVGRGWLAAVGLTAAAAMGLQVLAGHAAAPSTLRPVNLLAQWLHLLAAGVWAGGLVGLLAGLLRHPHQAPQSDTTTADGAVDRVQAVLRFSRLALPVVGVLAATGLDRALGLAGGWSGLTRTSFGRILDLKLLLFAGLLALAARNRYRLLPALAGPAGRLSTLRRSVTAEIALVAAVLLAAALLTQLPPGKFALAGTARPSPPANVQVQGSDVTTSVRLALTATPGTAGPNRFVAKISDYDSGQAFPAQRVALRFSLPDRPEISGATLELAQATDGSWQATGSQLSIDGRWTITALVQGPSVALTVPLQLRTRAVEPKVSVSKAPGQPDLYIITAPNGDSVQAYVDPGRPGANTVHFTFFTKAGSEQPIGGANATMTSSLGKKQTIDLQLLTAGHFAANLNLPAGPVSFTINATPAEGPPITASSPSRSSDRRGHAPPAQQHPHHPPDPGRPDRRAPGRLLKYR
jgi:copper transport protein